MSSPWAHWISYPVFMIPICVVTCDRVQARIQGGGALGRASTPGTEGPAPKARVPSSQGQKEGTLVSLEWLFNTIQV